jgi:hypothetical protein
MKTSRVALFIALVTISAALPVSGAPIDLTAGVWDVHDSIDVAGYTWDDTTLVFTSQTPAGADDALAGYFDWVSNAGHFGRELFIGTLTASRTLTLFGQLIDPTRPASGIVRASYSGDVTVDGTRIVNGLWSASGVIPGQWEATRGPRAVPESASMLLLGAGLIAALRLRRRR